MIFARQTYAIRCPTSALTDRTPSISFELHNSVDSPTATSSVRRHPRVMLGIALGVWRWSLF
jgi:hypothetical protein